MTMEESGLLIPLSPGEKYYLVMKLKLIFFRQMVEKEYGENLKRHSILKIVFHRLNMVGEISWYGAVYHTMV